MIELSIYSDDIRDMDERLDRAFDIKNGWGSESFDDNGNIAIDDMTRFPNGSVFQVIQKQQIKQLDATVHEITDCLDSAAKNIFSIGMRTGNKK